MEEYYKGWWDKRMMAAVVSKETLITLNMTDDQEKENFYHSSYINKSFFSAVSLLNDLMNGLLGSVFANSLGDLGSIQGCVIPKTIKMVLDTSLFNTQQYKVCLRVK